MAPKEAAELKSGSGDASSLVTPVPPAASKPSLGNRLGLGSGNAWQTALVNATNRNRGAITAPKQEVPQKDGALLEDLENGNSRPLSAKSSTSSSDEEEEKGELPKQDSRTIDGHAKPLVSGSDVKTNRMYSSEDSVPSSSSKPKDTDSAPSTDDEDDPYETFYHRGHTLFLDMLDALEVCRSTPNDFDEMICGV